jgi:hypothetical protein
VFFGYVFDYDDPAAASKKRAGEILSVYGFERHTLDAVTELMDAAFVPEQKSISGMVLHDAVYNYTGRIDFITMVDRLYREEMAYGKARDQKAWFRNLTETIEQNHFLTETARKLQSVPQSEQIINLQAFAESKLKNI